MFVYYRAYCIFYFSVDFPNVILIQFIYLLTYIVLCDCK